MKANNTYGLQFTRAQRGGIFVLLFGIILLQLLIYGNSIPLADKQADPEAEKWLAQQQLIDSLKLMASQPAPIRPFNPNFISDYKAYLLGMTVAETDRLQAFRQQNRYVNSVAEFQQVTGMEAGRLAKIAPAFQFPEWTRKKQSETPGILKTVTKEKKKFTIDLNKATKAELMQVRGIGEALSDRILNERERFGAFVSAEQFRYIWGIAPEVAEQLIEHFPVIDSPQPKKIDPNNASLKELMQFPYFRYAVAKQLITYRSMVGAIKSKEDLTKIKEFPVEKVDIIALYLDF